MLTLSSHAQVTVRLPIEVSAAGGATERVPVRTGLFAAGRVEIAGRGSRAGVQVVVTEG